jgi:hypothetical protein
MIQRIQTLFLLGAAISLALMAFLPLAEIRGGDGHYYQALSLGLKMTGGEVVFPTLPVLILVVFCALLSLINIFLFKRRKLQIRLCVYGIILCFGLIGLLYYFWVVMFRQFEIEDYWFKLPLVMPVAAIIFTYLAFRGIRKDEILIRSLDKLR